VILSETGRWACQLEGDCPDEELETAEEDTPDRYDTKQLILRSQAYRY
jgi:hypothetical protein